MNLPVTLSTDPSEGFVETPTIKKIIDRALDYLTAGFAVHFSGPTGTGKTTLAMHLAHKSGQPMMLMFGDEEFGTSDLVGDKMGYRKRKLIDNFIHSVLKTEEDVMQRWVDNRLTSAVKEGLTLIYDEFNRSKPEANNALLSVLEEGILSLPTNEEAEGYIRAHPNFRAIFTSNPEEYAGVHKTQDALLDRMVTIHLDYFDEETEKAIVAARTGISPADVQKIVAILRDFRYANGVSRPVTIRPAIVMGKILKQKGIPADANIPLFIDICIDALASGRNHIHEGEKTAEIVVALVKKHCSIPRRVPTGIPLGEKAKKAKVMNVARKRDVKGRFVTTPHNMLKAISQAKHSQSPDPAFTDARAVEVMSVSELVNPVAQITISKEGGEEK